MNDPQSTPMSSTSFNARLSSNPNDAIVDYLKDIRDQLVEIKRTLKKIQNPSPFIGDV